MYINPVSQATLFDYPFYIEGLLGTFICFGGYVSGLLLSHIFVSGFASFFHPSLFLPAPVLLKLVKLDVS
jgi:hypothetical protein